MILVMTVEPGYGGQKFLNVTLDKIRRAREVIDKNGVDVWLQVDGGISEDTIEIAAEAGADMFVAGSAVFGHDNAAERDRKSTRLNSSHVAISYAVFCLKKKKKTEAHNKANITTNNVTSTA